jgi:ribonucleoside-diphosphate reductase beta chain
LEPPPSYKVVITKASLQMTHIDISPTILTAHSEILQTQPAVYPYLSSETKRFAISQGSFSCDIDSIFENRQAQELIIGIVDSEAFHGSFATDPLKFENCGVNYVSCTTDGRSCTNSPIVVKYGRTAEDSAFTEGYKSLMGVSGVHGVIPFSPLQYFNGMTLYRFLAEDDQSVVSSGNGVVPLKRKGNMHVTIRFDKALTKPKTLIMFARFPAGFKIDKNRAVHPL